MEKDLSKAIEILYDMELNNYLMKRTIVKLNYTIDDLCHGVIYEKPVRRRPSCSKYDGVGVVALVAGIIGFIIGAVAGFFSIAAGISCWIGFPIVGAIIGAIKSSSDYKKDQEEIEREYEYALKEYEKCVQNEELKMKREGEIKSVLLTQREGLEYRFKDASIKLNKFYDRVGIDSSYRNIVPIGYMNEFIRLGIATKLQGADGLYYLIRKELRADELQHSLDEISNKLDVIINNQREIYSELLRMNNKCDNMISALYKSINIAEKNNRLNQTIAENTSITAYESERIAQEERFQSFMLLYNSMR